MLKIKDKDFLDYQFKKRRKYKELLDFIKTSCDLKITIKKYILGIDGIFSTKKKINISPSILEDILNELIKKEENTIDLYINTSNNLVEKVKE